MHKGFKNIIYTLVTALILWVVFFSVSGIKQNIDYYELSASFSQPGQLAKGGTVSMYGTKIGEIKKLIHGDSNTLLLFAINKNVLVPKGTLAKIESLGKNHQIAFIPSKSKEYHHSGDLLPSINITPNPIFIDGN